MRIALVVDGTRGDVQPLLVLGSALAAGGHELRVCAPPDFREPVAAAGFEFRPVGTEVRAWLTTHAHAFEGKPIRMLREAIRYTRKCLRLQFEGLPDATSGTDLIVGAGIQLAGPSVAALHRVPYRYVAYCPVLLPSSEHPSMLVTRQTLPSWVNALSWRGQRVFFNLVFRRALRVERAALGLPPVADVLGYLVGPKPTLAADAELAPLPAGLPDRRTADPGAAAGCGRAAPRETRSLPLAGAAAGLSRLRQHDRRRPEADHARDLEGSWRRQLSRDRVAGLGGAGW